MASYNQWMNQKIYSVCSSLPEAELKLDRGAFFDSILRTLDHLFFTDSTVFDILSGHRSDLKPFDQLQYERFSELHGARITRDKQIVQWAETVTEHDLEGIVDYGCPMHLLPEEMQNASTKYLYKVGSFPRQLIVAHYFNHQSHHRGQITTLLSQMGHDIGQTDLWGLPGASENF